MAVHAAGITVLLRSLMRWHGPNLAKIFGVIVIFGDNILTERLGLKH